MAHGDNLSSTFVYRDVKGVETSSTVTHPANTDIGALKSALPTTAELIDKITDAAIVSGTIIIPVDITGATVKADPLAGSDIHEGARFSFGTADNNVSSFRIPGFPESKIGDDGIVVDGGSDADVQALIDEIIGDTNSDEFGNDLVAFVGAIESFTASRG